MAIELVHSDAHGLDRIAPFLADALVQGGGLRDWTLEDVREMAEANQIDLWELRADGELFGGAVSVLRNFPRRIAFDILLLGTYPHRDRDLMVVLDLVKNVARAVGATTISGTGRPGWARMLKATERRIFEIEVPA